MRVDWLSFVWAGVAVGVFVYACIAWCLIRYRRKAGRAAARFENNTPLEIAYVAIPLAIVTALLVLSISIEGPVDAVSAAASNHVEVTAFRWSWRFSYEGGLINQSGTPDAPPTLYLPAGETTEVTLRSVDVTHSFWVPAFLFKRDAIPGMKNVFDLRPSRSGRFRGRCAQFCGLEHARMTFTVDVVRPGAFRRFLASRGTALP
jgi:cytochrome c oxidase subunit 2